MSILSGPEIIKRIKAGQIEIDPFCLDHVNPNSVDLTLGPELVVYNEFTLRMDVKNATRTLEIPASGLALDPGRVYLGSTVERTYCEGLVPRICGKSSIGRLGIGIHCTAGYGDDGFSGRWTLEITCVEPVILLPYRRICQIEFAELIGERKPYSGRYQGQNRPTASRSYE